MFTQIRIERAKRDMSIKTLAKETGMQYETLLSKLNGKSEFMRSEMIKIKNCFGGELTLDELFEDEQNQRTSFNSGNDEHLPIGSQQQVS